MAAEDVVHLSGASDQFIRSFGSDVCHFFHVAIGVYMDFFYRKMIGQWDAPWMFSRRFFAFIGDFLYGFFPQLYLLFGWNLKGELGAISKIGAFKPFLPFSE